MINMDRIKCMYMQQMYEELLILTNCGFNRVFNSSKCSTRNYFRLKNSIYHRIYLLPVIYVIISYELNRS